MNPNPAKAVLMRPVILSSDTWLELSTLGPWLVVSFTVPAIIVGVVTVFALLGTRPHERPLILHAAADFARALLLRSRRSPTTGQATNQHEPGREVEAAEKQVEASG